MISLGIMQGRLTPSRGRGIQFFPFDNWKEEFYTGKKLGIREIEWIFDYERYRDNPLWTETETATLKRIIEETGVKVRSVCFDYFMRRAFYKAENTDKEALRTENLEIAERVLLSMKEIGASLLEVPMVDDSSVKNDEEKKEVIAFLREVLTIANPLGIMVGCETDMPVGPFRSFLDEIKNEDIYANYDSGNSSGLGYDHEAEIKSLDKYIANVHIKDRQLHGTTMALGTGSADFDKVFSSLKSIGYDKSILLQAARGDDGDEENNIARQLSFVKSYCEKYDLEVY